MWTALGYGWRIATHIFYLVIILLVFSQLHGRPETVIVPILGLLYVAIRSFAAGQAWTMVALGQWLDQMDQRLRSLADPRYEPDPDERAEVRKQANKTRATLCIEFVALGPVSLLCLWKLFSKM